MRHERPGRRMLCLEEEEAAEPNQPGKEEPFELNAIKEQSCSKETGHRYSEQTLLSNAFLRERGSAFSKATSCRDAAVQSSPKGCPS